MPTLESAHLVVFMTRGVSLALWEHQGTFEREVALLRALRSRVGRLSLVTYGDAEDQALAGRLPDIEILFNRWVIPNRAYARWIPWLHRHQLQSATLLRTNQMKGAEVALRVQRMTGARLIVRNGYLWSLAAAQFNHGWRGRLNQAEAVRTEAAAFGQADAITVTTAEMKRHITATYVTPAERIRVIPNYVLDEFFAPGALQPQAGPHLLFVGRLEPDKSPGLVIEAARGLEAGVTFIGHGSLLPQLQRDAAAAGVQARFIPRVPHRDLPQHLRRATIFVLPSPREGHPKTLIEAMAAGRAVIGRDAPGIRDVIRHEATGLLAAGEPKAFREAAARLLGDEALRTRLERNAREFARAHYAFDKVLAAETDLLAEMAERGPRAA